MRSRRPRSEENQCLLFDDGREIGLYHFSSPWERDELVWTICPDRWLADHVESWLLRNDCAEDWEECWLGGEDGFVTSLTLWRLEAVESSMLLLGYVVEGCLC